MVKYNNNTIRRQDRLLTETEAITLLKHGEYGFLSMTDEDNSAYGIPINYAWDGDNKIYFHCALEGKKLRCIAINPQLSLCIVGATKIIPEKFTTSYKSIVIRCLATTTLTPEQRMHALDLIMKKYSPENIKIGKKYAQNSFQRTAIVCLEIIEMSGKCKIVE